MQRNAKLRNATTCNAEKCKEVQSSEMQRHAKLRNAKKCKAKKCKEMQS